jgi:hypothetical protein
VTNFARKESWMQFFPTDWGAVLLKDFSSYKSLASVDRQRTVTIMLFTLETETRLKELFEVSDIQTGTQDGVRKSAISFQQKSFEMAPHSSGSVP